MTNIEYDKQIDEVTKQIDEKKISMEILKENLIKETIKFTSKWYEEYAEQIVKNNYDTTNNMEKSQLKEMKNEIKNLIDKPEPNVNAVLLNDDLWIHRKYNLEFEYYAHQTNFKNKLKIALIKIVNILKKYGYEDSREWGGEDIYVRMDLSEDLSKDFEILLENYGRQAEVFRTLNIHFESLKENKQKEEVKDKWRSL